MKAPQTLAGGCDCGHVEWVRHEWTLVQCRLSVTWLLIQAFWDTLTGRARAPRAKPRQPTAILRINITK